MVHWGKWDFVTEGPSGGSGGDAEICDLLL